MIREEGHVHRARLVATAGLVAVFLAALLPVAVVDAASPYVLAFTTEPGSSSGPGTALSPQPVVHVTDNQTTPQAGINVSLAIATGTGTPGATLECANLDQQTDMNGDATFANCGIDLAGAGYQVRASESLGASVDSTPLDVPATPTDQLVFIASPTSAGAGQPFTTNPEVEIEDQNGLALSNVQAEISIGIGSNPGGGTLTCSGGTTVATVNGIAIFTGCSISAAGLGYTLVAAAFDATPPTSLNEAVSASFSVDGTSMQLVFISTPTGAGAGQAFPTDPEVAIEDLNGNLITSQVATISLSLAANPGGGALNCSGGLQVTTVNGLADFTGCSISAAGVGYSLLAVPISTSPPIALGSAVSPPFTVDASSAQLAFTVYPSVVGAGQPFPTDVGVAIEDASANVMTSVSATIGLSIGSNPGSGTLSCSGGLQAATANGIATFTGCSVSSPGAGYTLLADALLTDPATALNAAVSPAFTVSGAASQLSLTASSSVIALDDPVTFEVHLEPARAGGTIEIDASPDQVAWSAIGSVSADPSGDATLVQRPASNAWYRAVFAGSTDLQAATSETVRVVVRQTASLRPVDSTGGRTISKGTSITFTTTVRPIGPALPVGHVTFVLYHLNGSSWVLSSSRTETIDADGQAAWTWTAGTAGHWYVRTIADPTPANANSAWSAVQKYTVQ